MSQALVRASGEVVDRPKWSGLWLIALAVVAGAAAGWLTVILRTLISYMEFLFFGGGSVADNFSRGVAVLPWWKRMIGPIVAGCVVALLLRVGVAMGWGKYPRPYGLADLVATRRLRGSLRASSLGLRDSFLSGLIAIVSIGGGASTGRECPGMHMGASVGLLPGRILGLDFAQRRLLMAAGAAAALSAILSAPLAAVILIRELLLPRMRLAALGPVAAASAAGWLAARAFGGPFAAIPLPPIDPVPVLFHALSPVTAILAGLAAAGLVALWDRTPRLVDLISTRRKLPLWLLPVFGGVLIALLAVGFPHAMGLGYGALRDGVSGAYSAGLMLVTALAKALAAAIAFSFRFGGGRIAPALVIGGLTGAALGVVIGLPVGEASAAQVYFGVVMMTAVLAGVLDSPLGAAVLSLELSGSPEIAAASLAASYISVLIVRRLTGKRRGENERRL